MSCHMMWCDVIVLSCFVYRYALMQSCWMENPLMRPTFEDITKQIKYLLRKNPVCTTCLLVTVIVSAFSNPVVFFLPFSVSVYLKKISLVNYYHFLCNSFQTHEQFIKFKQSKSWPWGCLDIKGAFVWDIPNKNIFRLFYSWEQDSRNGNPGIPEWE